MVSREYAGHTVGIQTLPAVVSVNPVSVQDECKLDGMEDSKT